MFRAMTVRTSNSDHVHSEAKEDDEMEGELPLCVTIIAMYLHCHVPFILL